uniref:ATP synthase F0 subunit 8 n=1 Tax=Barilius barila TaxID=198510 RepID=UPI0020018766|nr:ATP synthase F0 subunit 8 [Barilius barila]UNQ32306.1 ATP synthase F0 subunit 8 [Barilius barila]UVF28218.1 ATP synthase F0 subunit 8 [Barilius barila]
MPQLNPDPWFFTLALSWVVFLTIVPTKVLAYIQPNEPTLMDADSHKFGSWNWPW